MGLMQVCPRLLWLAVCTCTAQDAMLQHCRLLCVRHTAVVCLCAADKYCDRACGIQHCDVLCMFPGEHHLVGKWSCVEHSNRHTAGCPGPALGGLQLHAAQAGVVLLLLLCCSDVRCLHSATQQCCSHTASTVGVAALLLLHRP